MSGGIRFTHISVANGEIGVLLPGSKVRDEPRRFKTEAAALEYIGQNYGAKNVRPVILDHTCYARSNGRTRFKAREFGEEVALTIARVLKPK